MTMVAVRGITIHRYIKISLYKKETMCISDVKDMIRDKDLVLSKAQFTVFIRYKALSCSPPCAARQLWCSCHFQDRRYLCNDIKNTGTRKAVSVHNFMWWGTHVLDNVVSDDYGIADCFIKMGEVVPGGYFKDRVWSASSSNIALFSKLSHIATYKWLTHSSLSNGSTASEDTVWNASSMTGVRSTWFKCDNVIGWR